VDVLVLIDKPDDLVRSAKRVRRRDQVCVDRESCRHSRPDAVDDPEEIKRARWIVTEREELLADATHEAGRIVRAARERQTSSCPGINWFARPSAWPRASSTTRGREREIPAGAEGYADDILDTLEVNLSRFIAAVERGERLQGRDAPTEGG
jgi:hypothetical protein